IAGDEMEGRETGTEGQRKAATYIEAQFKALGLKSAESLNGYQQQFPLYQDSLISSELKVSDVLLEYGKDYITPASSNETGTFKGKKIVFVGYGIDDSSYNDYAGIDVKDKIVVFFTGEPRKDGEYITTGTKRAGKWTYPGTSEKLAVAKLHGAIGALVIGTTMETFSPKTTENSRKTNIIFKSIASEEKPLDYALLSHAFAKRLIGNQFDSLLKKIVTGEQVTVNNFPVKDSKISFDYKEYRTTTNASNVIGVLEGSDKKDEFVFLTAHYDHLGKHDGKIFYGADDDGSGTVAVIEMAEAFARAKAEGKGPRRSIVFMTVSGEEKGLWGSEFYSDHPVFPLDKTTVDLNTDMVGRIDTERKTGDSLNYVYVIGHDKLSSELALINEGANQKYTNLVFDYKFDDPKDPNRIYYRSDHYNFARKGVPILFFYDGMLLSDYHKSTDTVDKIYWDLYQKRVQMIFHTAWEMANMDNMLKRDLP
ncbi:MAG: M28 family peptidase, partial [Ferruginibacter sp.]